MRYEEKFKSNELQEDAKHLSKGLDQYILRLKNQCGLIEDLMNTNNTKMMSKELEALDKSYDQMKEFGNTMDKSSLERREIIAEKGGLLNINSTTK